jgi:translation initiation factor IF-1
MVDDVKLEFEGVVVNAVKGKFDVEVSENYHVLCVLSGKIRQNSVKILVGDRVRIQVGEYDTTMGRIIFRLK